MFCTNCGSELPDGSKFCSACGTKLAEKEVYDIKVDTEKKSSSVIFDWSNVQDERNKREIQDVHSPWGTVRLDKDKFDAGAESSTGDQSRTMSFIDILRKEKEQNEKDVVEAYSEPPQETFSEIDKTDNRKESGVYVPPLYDLKDREEKYYDNREQEFGKHGKSNKEEVTFATMDFDSANGGTSSNLDEEDFLVEPTVDRGSNFEPTMGEPDSVINRAIDNTNGNLEAELADILSTGMQEPSAEKFDSNNATPVNDTQVDVDSYIEEPLKDESIIKIENGEEPQLEAKPLVEEKTEEQTQRDEIEDLKKRLAELSGGIEPVQEESETQDKKEDLEIELVNEPTVQEDIKNEEPKKEEKQVKAEDAIATEQKVAEAEQESDAVSLDDLEKELGANSTEEEISAEATKKIDKFYTLYKKNEEFQKLLDEEYSMLNSEGEVPHVDDIVSKTNATVEPTPQTEPTKVEKKAEPVQIEKKEVKPAETTAKSSLADNSKPIITKAEKKEQKKEKKEEKKKKKAERGESGSKLTVLAVIIVIILVLVLAMILVLYCAPNSVIGLKLNQIIETITSYFSGIGVIKGRFLL